jgi:hypothetical protein
MTFTNDQKRKILFSTLIRKLKLRKKIDNAFPDVSNILNNSDNATYNDLWTHLTTGGAINISTNNLMTGENLRNEIGGFGGAFGGNRNVTIGGVNNIQKDEICDLLKIGDHNNNVPGTVNGIYRNANENAFKNGLEEIQKNDITENDINDIVSLVIKKGNLARKDPHHTNYLYFRKLLLRVGLHGKQLREEIGTANNNIDLSGGTPGNININKRDLIKALGISDNTAGGTNLEKEGGNKQGIELRKVIQKRIQELKVPTERNIDLIILKLRKEYTKTHPNQQLGNADPRHADWNNLRTTLRDQEFSPQGIRGAFRQGDDTNIGGVNLNHNQICEWLKIRIQGEHGVAPDSQADILSGVTTTQLIGSLEEDFPNRTITERELDLIILKLIKGLKTDTLVNPAMGNNDFDNANPNPRHYSYTYIRNMIRDEIRLKGFKAETFRNLFTGNDSIVFGKKYVTYANMQKALKIEGNVVNNTTGKYCQTNTKEKLLNDWRKDMKVFTDEDLDNICKAIITRAIANKDVTDAHARLLHPLLKKLRSKELQNLRKLIRDGVNNGFRECKKSELLHNQVFGGNGNIQITVNGTNINIAKKLIRKEILKLKGNERDGALANNSEGNVVRKHLSNRAYMTKQEAIKIMQILRAGLIAKQEFRNNVVKVINNGLPTGRVNQQWKKLLHILTHTCYTEKDIKQLFSSDNNANFDENTAFNNTPQASRPNLENNLLSPINGISNAKLLKCFDFGTRLNQLVENNKKLDNFLNLIKQRRQSHYRFQRPEKERQHDLARALRHLNSIRGEGSTFSFTEFEDHLLYLQGGERAREGNNIVTVSHSSVKEYRAYAANNNLIPQQLIQNEVRRIPGNRHRDVSYVEVDFKGSGRKDDKKSGMKLYLQSQGNYRKGDSVCNDSSIHGVFQHITVLAAAGFKRLDLNDLLGTGNINNDRIRVLAKYVACIEKMRTPVPDNRKMEMKLSEVFWRKLSKRTKPNDNNSPTYLEEARQELNRYLQPEADVRIRHQNGLRLQ